MANVRGKSICVSPTWAGRADCKHCAIRDQVLFATIPDDVLDQLLIPIDNLHYGHKMAIYNLNDPGRYVFTLRRGAVKLQQLLSNGASRVVRVLKTGDFLGLEALIGRPYAHTAIALHSADICRIPVELIHKLNAGETPLYQELLLRWQRHLDQADTFITELSTGSSRARTARLLLMLEGHAGALGACPLSREDMGQILGITTETASRVVAEFKRLGFVTEVDGVLHFSDRDALLKFAEAD